MINKQDLKEAIAECQGVRNPNSNTCLKLAAFYTILDHMDEKEDQIPVYSYAAQNNENTVNVIDYTSNTEFGKVVYGREPNEVWTVIDELMSTIQILDPKLYESVMRRL